MSKPTFAATASKMARMTLSKSAACRNIGHPDDRAVTAMRRSASVEDRSIIAARCRRDRRRLARNLLRCETFASGAAPDVDSASTAPPTHDWLARA